MDTNTVKVALDAIRGKVRGNYTSSETSDALRNAFIEMNGGSTKIDAKNFYRGNGLFELVEEIVPVIVDEGIREDDELMKLVEYRNVAYGDEQDFVVRHKGYLAVRKVADGIMGVRRQRFDNGETLTIKTEARYVKVYEELGRLMTGRIDFNEFVDAVAEAFKRQIIADAYACLNSVSNATPGLSATYVRSGSFSEAELLELIDHVEAATGKKAKIIGTRSALRKVTTAVVSHEAETDMYNLGFYGKFNGCPMYAMRQAHLTGTDTFAFRDDVLYVIAGDEKPIKVINEGTGLLKHVDALDNDDLTEEYTEIMMWGVGAIFAEKIGIYTLS